MRRFFAVFTVFVVLAGLIGGLAYFQFAFKPEMIRSTISKTPQPVQTVATVEAMSEAWPARLTAIGTLRAVAGIDVAPQIGGVIRSLNFDRGEDVQKGAVLAELDDTVEQADLRSFQATLKNAEVTLERQQTLVRGGSTSRSTLDQAQAARDTAAAAVERSRALIAQKTITAPFAGRVGLRKGDIGQYVSPGTSIANLQQLDPIYVDFPVPEQNLAVVKVGAVVEFSVDAFPAKTFVGKVYAIDARVSAETRNVMVRGEAPNPEKRLLPGMFADVSVAAGPASEVVTIPRTGVSYSLYGNTVFVVKPEPSQDGAAQQSDGQVMIVDRRVVKVGDAREDRVAISDGLKAGERIVSIGQLKLQPNMRVRVDDNAGLPARAATRTPQ